MRTKIYLTSIIAISFAIPAFAEPTNTSSTFPDASQNEYMQEDYTYTGAATSTNMAGVYQDNATVYANAKYHNATYALAAGKYLPANSETPIDCNQSGYYCEGDQNGVNYSSSAQGLTQCPTGYGNSGTGASANTDCYRTCTNNDVAHSTGTVNGGYYYGDNNQCEPTDCENGWHKKSGMSGSALQTAVGTGVGENSAYVNGSGSFSEVNHDGQGEKGQSYYGITANNTWAVDYGSTKGMLVGTGRCSSVQGDNNSYTWTNPTILTTSEMGAEGGQYCYCNVTGYTPAGGTLQSVSSPWVFDSDHGPVSFCASYCASNCARNMRGGDTSYFAFRAAVLGSVSPSPASCEANTINISWDGATSTAVNANDAGSVTYGGDIRTPQSAIHVPGKVFDGWEFSTTAPVSPVTE